MLGLKDLVKIFAIVAAVVLLFAMTTEFPSAPIPGPVFHGSEVKAEANIPKINAIKKASRKSAPDDVKIVETPANKAKTAPDKEKPKPETINSKKIKPKATAKTEKADPVRDVYDESRKVAYTNLGKKEYRIMASGQKTVDQLAEYLLYFNPDIDATTAYLMAGYYVDESENEGVNHDIAFCQMCLETGFLRFGGIVHPSQNNFCGLGAVNSSTPGERFPTRRMGVIAHIQHLKAYASKQPLRGQLVDRRFKWVKRGSAPTVDGLAGKWAADREYSLKIKSLLYRLDLSTRNYLSTR